MFMIRYQLTTGEVRLSEAFATASEADIQRWVLLKGSHVTAAEIVPADHANALIETDAMA